MTIEAAGGLLWRSTPGGKTLAVVFRTEHQDWTLPKGKKEENESIEETALREVREETGFAAELGSYAGMVEYEVKGTPKTVRYWHMRAGKRIGEPKRGEIERVEWLSVEEAIDRLEYRSERNLVQVSARRIDVPELDRVRFRPWSRTEQRALNALASAIAECEALLERGIEEARKERGEAHWRSARQSLDRAKEAHRRRIVDEGWVHLQTARRAEVHWASPELRGALASQLRNEAQAKLTGWRRDTVLDLVDEKRAPPARDALAWALYIRDGRDHDEYRKLAILRDKLNAIAWILGGLIALLVLLAFVPGLPFLEPEVAIGPVPFVVLVLLFGAIGGAVSAIMPVSLGRHGGRIPDRLMSWSVTVLRPLVGAAMAGGIYTLLRAGIISVGGNGGPSASLAIAFLSGFSEKWVLGTIQDAFGGSK